MGAYATYADAIRIYGESYVIVPSDRDSDGIAEKASFDENLLIASSHMDGYLFGHYPLPLVTADPMLTKVCVDLAIYNSAPTQDVRTDEMRRRYEDAILWLEKVAAGKIQLVVDPVPGADTATRNPVTIDVVRCGDPCGSNAVRPQRGFDPCILKSIL